VSASSSRASASSPIGSDRDGLRQHRGGAARRITSWVVAAAVTGLLAFDLARAPQDQWSARALLAAIGAYQATVSPVLHTAGVRCRFVPTCSHYGADAIRKDGALVGSLRAMWRVARCGPWTKMGTVDPA
jgi:putative membrane protein insertion efficiency factor